MSAERRGEAFDLLNDVIGECECVVFVDLYREGGGEDHAAGHGAEKEILTAAALQLKVLFAASEETAKFSAVSEGRGDHAAEGSSNRCGFFTGAGNHRADGANEDDLAALFAAD